MQHFKNSTVTVIVGALVMIKKGKNKHINKMPINQNLYEIQKNCTLRSCLSPYENAINVGETYHPKEVAKT